MATALTYGYSDITTNTRAEQLLVAFILLFSSVLYATIFGQVTTLVESLDQMNRRYQMELQRFIEFASMYKLPHRLRSRIFEQVQYTWQVTCGINMESILTALPSGMRRDVQMYLLASIVTNFPIFAK